MAIEFLFFLMVFSILTCIKEKVEEVIMTEKVLKHLVKELDHLKPYLTDNIMGTKQNLSAQGYKETGFQSKMSIFGIGEKLNMKRPVDFGRYQIRLWGDKTGRIDWDTSDPDDNLIKTALHSMDLAYYLFSEVLDLLPFDSIKIDKNYIEFEY